MTNGRVLKAPYRIYDGENKELGKFRTEKQACEVAKKVASKLVFVEIGSFNSVLITHLYRKNGIIYEDEIKSYAYKGK